MRLVYVTCILLATTICSIASENAVKPDEDIKSQTHPGMETTTPVPAESSSLPAAANKPNATIVTTANATVTNNNTDATSNTKTDGQSSANDGPNTTTAIPPKSSNVSTTTPVTTKPTTMTKTTTVTKEPTATKAPTATPKKTDATLTDESPVTKNASIPSTQPVTTAIPVSTIVGPSSSPYKERNFDGLSFVGGIILTVCLMGIGVFSRKFYRTLTERNYRTL